ncbi:DNA polymerase III subunit beta [Candidatus Kaiserbacteria bacterium CG10_big_fil_rev_8_21_14_0_10_56_12]|uniref:Beta sliding clamp n=1 Tax=Candidatus Kaiserbacteria bacterium CG10_big_fil_rev_8_21_14_0_10_56_12 TaxID=1974611 RepID=A0A2H0U9Y8_9BACT|nr:MAG: DNA polymerase III subunit beta [Candidatus Kaiserbacteria bacterium CG10_big_fil_rev_8_21_14_0_10_56_12]
MSGMNISIEKKEFSEAVHKVARFSEKRAGTLPALSTILILAGDDGIKMRATNLETGIDLRVDGKVFSHGAVALPATTLQQIAGSLAGEGDLSLEHAGDLVTLTSGGGKSTIKTVPYDDFPLIPLPESATNTFTIAGTLIKGLFSSVAACASASTVRPELASICLQVEGGMLTVVATDSFRLAEKKAPLNKKGLQGTLLIPAKNALDIAQVLPDDEIEVAFDEHQCAFSTPTSVVVSRLTNASYPDYRQIIPRDHAVEAVVLKKDLETALRRTTVFSDTFQKVSLSIDPKKNTISLFAKNTDVGEAVERLSAKIHGDALTLSFNHRFLSAAFNLTSSESIVLQAVRIGRPLIVRGVGDNSMLYLISPMNQ